MRIPGFSETNCSTLCTTRWTGWIRFEGRKYIILVTTGIDTFSKLNLDQITKKIKTTHDVTIFPMSVGWQCAITARLTAADTPTVWAFRSAKWITCKPTTK